jgi:hypothetical protein
MTVVRPGFFLIGAPKCGTSALAHYLAEHPQICFSYPKEPYFWASDYAGLRRQFGVDTLDAYLKLFETEVPNIAASGEGSTVYLASAVAVPQILAFNPDSRLIVMLRDPVELVAASHMQELSHLNEAEPDFIRAWELQEERARGRNIPAGCYEPLLLQYRKTAQLGFQMDRLLKLIAKDRLHVIYFEDLKKSVQDVYRATLEFLNLRDDGRIDFPRVNESRIVRSRMLVELLNGRTGTVVSRFLKQRLPGPVANIANRVKKSLTTRTSPRQALPADLERRLRKEFRDDIQLLADRTGRCLNQWLN